MELTRIYQLARALDYSEFEIAVMKEQANEQLETEASDIYHSIRSSVSYDWLDDSTRKEARKMWDSHKTMDDNMRINAIKYIISKAKDAGYIIGIKKAKELFDLHCS